MTRDEINDDQNTNVGNGIKSETSIRLRQYVRLGILSPYVKLRVRITQQFPF